MLDVNLAFRHMMISTTSPMAAVQEVRHWIEDRGNDAGDAMGFMSRVFGVCPSVDEVYAQKMCTPNTYAMTIAQAMTEGAIKQGGQIDDANLLLENAKARAESVIMKPGNRCMYVEEPRQASANTTIQSVATSVETKVEVKADGTIKKGGKGLLAEALYRKHALEATVPVTNQEFIKILMDEAQMTKGGATTYAYNMKAKFGTKENPKLVAA